MFCKGKEMDECVKCLKNVVNIEQTQQYPVHPNIKIQLMPTKCCLCLSQMHVECLEVPFLLLIRGAYYHELSEEEYSECVKIYETYKHQKELTQEQVVQLRKRLMEIL